jgi:hypothetical protein
MATDGPMLLTWFVAGTIYYQMMRRPGLVISLITSVRGAIAATTGPKPN